MNQKDAVFEEIKRLKPTEVGKSEPVRLTKQEKKVVEERLFDGFRKGKIQYNSELPSDDKLRLYVSGLVSNWLRKDRRLNGDRTYRPSRSHSARTAVTPVAVRTTAQISPEELERIRSMAAPGEEVTVYVVRRPATAPATEENDDSSRDNDARYNGGNAQHTSSH